MPKKKEIEELENALATQEQLTADSLKQLGFNNGPRLTVGASGVFDLASEQAAEDARRKLRTIAGVSARGRGTQVIVEPESLRQAIDQMAREHGWPIGWYDIIQK